MAGSDFPPPRQTPCQPTPSSSSLDGRAGVRWSGRARRLVSVVFVTIVAGLLVRYGVRLDWAEVGRALLAPSPGTLLLAAGLAATSHALYSSFDLIGRRQTRHGLSAGRTIGVAFVSYAFNLNFGALVGGVAFRYRLYTRYGLDTPAITQVLALSVATNWLGYCLVAGLLFLVHPPAMPGDWALTDPGLRIVGALLLSAVAVYFLLCAWGKGRTLRWGRYCMEVPGWRMAAVQFALSSGNWLIAAGIVYVLLDAKVSYVLVTGVFLSAAIAGAVTHVPAGLGVLEAVFIALLGQQIPAPHLVASLLAYRAIYYLAPLAIALAGMLWSMKSIRARRERISSNVRA